MPTELRKAESPEMQKNIRIVRKMTSGMGFDENMGKVNWKAVRLISGIGYLFSPKEKGVKFRKYKYSDCSFETAVPEKLQSQNLIIYLHGGGFVSGSASASRGYASMLAAYSGCQVISADYSLAPEKPFPHGFNDCCNVVERAGQMFPGAKTALVGESAGANLFVAAALKLGKKISSVTVHSPFMDFTGSLDRSEHEIDDFTVKVGCLKPLNEIYVGDNRADAPYISPIYGDFTDFPPTFITCDTNETLYADSAWLYRKLTEQGTDVRMIEMQGAFHAFATIGTGSPETARILSESVEHILSSF